jgi:nicotinic acid mononucleotide adenylyltransferase
MVRERLTRGEPWRFLVPEGARKVIEENGLYGTQKY